MKLTLLKLVSGPFQIEDTVILELILLNFTAHDNLPTQMPGIADFANNHGQ